MSSSHQNGNNNNNINSSIPRLVLRNLPYHQSRNRVSVQNDARWLVWSIRTRHDFFHALLSRPPHITFILLITTWTGIILLFAVLYVIVDQSNDGTVCVLGHSGVPIHFVGAFAFSLQTCTTVGYTLPNGSNAFFEPSCGTLQLLIYLQMICSMIFNALFLAFLYSRLAICNNRGAQVVLSKQAVVNVVDGGQIRFQVRCYDLDARHPIVEAHVRMYVVYKDRPVPRQLRVIQPNDELGGQLLLSIPNVAVHHIDRYSLLHPAAMESTPTIMPGRLPCTWGTNLRQVDSYTANRHEFICPVCSETFGTAKRWIKHVQYQRIVDRVSGYPIAESHLSISDEILHEVMQFHHAVETDPVHAVSAIREYIATSISEIICVVEGIDPLTSGTFQALQSYQYSDIVFNADAEFSPCLEIQKYSTSWTTTGTAIHKKHNSRYPDPIIQVNLDQFHAVETRSRIQTAPTAAPSAPSIPPPSAVVSNQIEDGKMTTVIDMNVGVPVNETMMMKTTTTTTTTTTLPSHRPTMRYPQRSLRPHDSWLDDSIINP